MKKLRWLCLFLALLAPAFASANDFGDALAAYDAGDYRKAALVWRELAEAGNVPAQSALALLYDQGLGVTADPARAADWYRRAAQAGDPIAQIALAEKYERGHGVGRDPAMAFVWFDRAARGGNDHAATQVERLAKTVSKDSIEEARRKTVSP